MRYAEYDLDGERWRYLYLEQRFNGCCIKFDYDGGYLYGNGDGRERLYGYIECSYDLEQRTSDRWHYGQFGTDLCYAEYDLDGEWWRYLYLE